MRAMSTKLETLSSTIKTVASLGWMGSCEEVALSAMRFACNPEK
jgi:hypothetical protein